MLYLETHRLKLIPLTLQQLELLAISRNLMERTLGLNLSNFELNADPAFIQDFETVTTVYSIPKVKENLENYAWYTSWIIVLKDLNLTVGGIRGSGLPSESGQVTIGYFTDKKFEGQGISAEALEKFATWVFENPNVKSIIADTLIDGYASQKVLQKVGFQSLDEVEEGLRWIKYR